LVVILGLLVMLAVIIIICYRCRYKFFPKTNRSKILNHVRTDGNNSYEAIIRTSENSSQNNSKLNGTKPHRASMSTSACGFNEQENGTQQLV
jgi:multidrug efflux pump subunit AcrB